MAALADACRRPIGYNPRRIADRGAGFRGWCPGSPVRVLTVSSDRGGILAKARC
jgi:hypothetical protein